MIETNTQFTGEEEVPDRVAATRRQILVHRASLTRGKATVFARPGRYVFSHGRKVGNAINNLYTPMRALPPFVQIPPGQLAGM